MDFNKLIDSITPEAYENLKRAIEVGKWPDGILLTADQKEHCMQAIIAYDSRHKSEEDRVAFVPSKESRTKKHTHCSSDGLEKEGSDDVDEAKPLKWDN